MIARSNRNFLRGFTLVELLVVMAIIAILIAVLSPALSNALVHARTAKCESNLHQISAGMINFASDNNGRFPISGGTIPWGTTDSTTGQNGWCQQVGPYLGVTSDPTAAGATATIYQCPDWAIVTSGTGSALTHPNQYYSYYNGAHAAYSANGHNFAAVVMAAIHNPSSYILAGDISFNTFATNDGDKDNYGQDPSFGTTTAAPTTYLTSPIHGGSTNIAFADGHVENLRTFNPVNMTTVYQGPGSSYYYLY